MNVSKYIIDMLGKKVVIMGGSWGLGWEMVFGFVVVGVDVCIMSCKIELCEEMVKEIEVFGREVFFYVCYVGYWD